MAKGEQSRQRLIDCAAELFWKNGYAATGVSGILNAAGLPKGSFYFYFKSKDELALAVISNYQERILKQMEAFSEDQTWDSFVLKLFLHLKERAENSSIWGCPFAVMGMEFAFQKPEAAKIYLDAIKKFGALFRRVLLQSGLSETHADILSERLLALYQGNLLLGRISQDGTFLECAEKDMIQVCREYRTFYGV